MSRSVAFIVCAAMALSMQPAYFLMTAHAGIQNITKDLEERNKQADEKAKELQERDKRADEQLRQVQEGRRQAEEKLGKAEEQLRQVQEELRISQEIGTTLRNIDAERQVFAKYQNVGDLRTLSNKDKEELQRGIKNLKMYVDQYSKLCKMSTGTCNYGMINEIKIIIKNFSIDD